MDWNKLAVKLGAFGAGVQGKGPEYLQDLDERRKRALIQDARQVQQSLINNDPAKAVELLNEREGLIRKLAGDPSDTIQLRQKIESGDLQGALEDVGTVVNFARMEGLIPPETTQFKMGENERLFERGPNGIEQIVGPAPEDPGDAKDRALRERQIRVNEASLAERQNKLSAAAEQALIKSQDAVQKSQMDANSFDNLANDFERYVSEAGVMSTFSEAIKNVTGSQDAVSEYRRRFNNVRLSQALKNLPPGPATDKDVKEAFKGVPKENAGAEQVASFLRGAAKLARFDAGWNQFKADYISSVREPSGMNSRWRSKVRSEVLDRDVTIGEIYYTAQMRNISPEEAVEFLEIPKTAIQF